MINKRPTDVDCDPDPRTSTPDPTRLGAAPILGKDLTSLVRNLLQNLGDQVKEELREGDPKQRDGVKLTSPLFENCEKLKSEFVCTRKRKHQSKSEETNNPKTSYQSKRIRLSESRNASKKHISFTSLLFSDLKQTFFTANANENNDNSTVASTPLGCQLSEQEQDNFTDFCLNAHEDDSSCAEIFAKLSGRSLSYNTNPLSSVEKPHPEDTLASFLPKPLNPEEIKNSETLISPEEEVEIPNTLPSLSKLSPVSRIPNYLPSTVTTTCLTRPALKHTRSDPGFQTKLNAGYQSQQSLLSRAAKFENLSPLQGYNFGDFADTAACSGTTRNRNANATTSVRPIYLTRHPNPTTNNDEFDPKNICDSVVAKKSDTGLLTLQFSRHTTTSSSTSSTSHSTSSPKNKTLFAARQQSTRICACSSHNVHTKTCDAFYTAPKVRQVTFRPRQRRALIKSLESSGSGHQRKESECSISSSSFDQDIAASVRCLCRIEEQCPSCKSKRDHPKRSPPTEESSLIALRGGEKQANFVRRSHSCGRAQTQSYGGFNKNLLKQRSFSNNHKCFDEQEHSSKGARADRRSSHHCCDPFCFLFGGSSSSSHASNPSLVFSKLLYAAQAASPKNRTLGVITPDQTEMGCFHSVSNKSKVGPCRTNIHSDVQATIDQSPTIIEEYSPIVLRYRTPYFRASAQVVMPPIRRKETWTVGWIQACDYMKFINQYGNLGCSSWEIPALKSGRIPAVSDSDGVSYPWYGNTTEIATIVGPTDSYRSMNLTMNDNFYPSVTWDIPVSEGTSAHLTRIVRDQSFVTWLAAINETTKEIIVLKTVRWKFYLEIDIDPSRELGSRSRIVAPRIQKQPLITNGPCEKSFFNSPVRNRRRGTDNNSNSNYIGQIPISALVRPSANNAQTLIWRPTDATPIIVVPAKEEHKDTNELILFNGCSAMHGKESIVKEISKQEMLQFQQMAR